MRAGEQAGCLVWVESGWAVQQVGPQGWALHQHERSEHALQVLRPQTS